MIINTILVKILAMKRGEISWTYVQSRLEIYKEMRGNEMYNTLWRAILAISIQNPYDDTDFFMQSRAWKGHKTEISIIRV